jgi:Predicted phosphatases
VVGRDTVRTHKPEPESLLAAVDALGVDPDRCVFVGDSESDRVTADRAGVPFVWAADAVDA